MSVLTLFLTAAGVLPAEQAHPLLPSSGGAHALSVYYYDYCAHGAHDANPHPSSLLFS